MSDHHSARLADWIVQGPDVASGRLRPVLAPHGIRQVQQVAADVLVLSMTAASAERLKAEFPNLIVEANSKLGPLR